MTRMAEAKAAAVACWTADPCGAVEGEPGTEDYTRRLVRARRGYAPWMDTVLDYSGASDLDVLDVGCGQGVDLIRYAQAGARVTGLDLTPRHVALARAHLGALNLPGVVVEGDAEEMPFADSSFDRVSSNGVLHHTPDFQKALAEIERVLRPHGEVRVILYNRRSLHYWLWQVLYEGVAKGGLRRERSMPAVLSAGVERTSIGARPLVRVYSPREVANRMKRAGFGEVTTVVRHFSWGDIPYGQLIERFTPFTSSSLQERIGQICGWYVTGMGRKR